MISKIFCFIESVFRVISLFELIVFIAYFFTLSASPTEDSKPLLRVYPIFREEECEWGVRLDICRYCIKKGERYAQKIFFHSDAPYRVHGCYTEKKGFYTHELPTTK